MSQIPIGTGEILTAGDSGLGSGDDPPSSVIRPSEWVDPDDHATTSTRPPTMGSNDRRRLRERFRGARSRVDDKKRSLAEKAELERERNASLRTVLHLVDEDRFHGGGLLAGGLAYRLFIWLLPASLVATSLLRLFADFRAVSPSAAARSAGLGASLAATVDRAASQAGRATPILLVTGLAVMLWASRGVLKALRLISAIAWGLRPSPLQSPIRATLLTAGTLMVLCLYGFAFTPLYGGSLTGDIAATILSTSGMVAIATWAADALPHPPNVGKLQLIFGAILFALGTEALQLISTFYFARKLERVDDLYGALGFAAVFMAYLYLLARLAVLGLMTNAARQPLRIAKSGDETP